MEIYIKNRKSERFYVQKSLSLHRMNFTYPVELQQEDRHVVDHLFEDCPFLTESIPKTIYFFLNQPNL